MLELLTIFLLTFALAATAIWLYRSLSGWKGLGENLVRGLDKTDGMKIARQGGFIALFSAPRQKAKNIRLRNTNRNIKAPWGW